MGLTLGLYGSPAWTQERGAPSPETIRILEEGQSLSTLPLSELQNYLETQRTNRTKRELILQEMVRRFHQRANEGQFDSRLLFLALPYLDERGLNALSRNLSQACLTKAPGESTNETLIRFSRDLLPVFQDANHSLQGKWLRGFLITQLGDIIEYGRLTNSGAHPSIIQAWRLAFDLALPDQQERLIRLMGKVEPYPIARRARNAAFPEAIANNRRFVPENIQAGKHPYQVIPYAQIPENLLPHETIHLWPSSIIDSLTQARATFLGNERRLQIEVGLREVSQIKRALNLHVTTKPGEPIAESLQEAIFHLAQRYALPPFPTEIPTRERLEELNAKLRTSDKTGENNQRSALLEEKLTVQLLRIQNTDPRQLRSQIPAMLEGVEGTFNLLNENAYPLPQADARQGRTVPTTKVRNVTVTLLDGSQETLKTSVPTTIHHRDQAAAVRALEHIRNRHAEEIETLKSWCTLLQESLETLNRLRFEDLKPRQISTLEKQTHQKIENVLEELPNTRINAALKAGTDLSTVIGPGGYLLQKAYKEAQARIRAALNHLDYDGRVRSSAYLDRWAERTEAERKSEWRQLRHTAQAISAEVEHLENDFLTPAERSHSMRTLFNLVQEAQVLGQIPTNLLPSGWEHANTYRTTLAEAEQNFFETEQAVKDLEALIEKTEALKSRLQKAQNYFSGKGLTIWASTIEAISLRWADYGKPGFAVTEAIDETRERLADIQWGLDHSERLGQGNRFSEALGRHLRNCTSSLEAFASARAKTFPRIRSALLNTSLTLETARLEQAHEVLEQKAQKQSEDISSRIQRMPPLQALYDFQRLLLEVAGSSSSARGKDITLHTTLIPGPWMESTNQNSGRGRPKEALANGFDSAGKMLSSRPIAGAGVYAIGEYGSTAIEAAITKDPMVLRRLTLSHVLNNLEEVYIPLEIGGQVGGMASRRFLKADLGTSGLRGASARATRLWFALLAVELANGHLDWKNQPRQMGNIVLASFTVNRTLRLIRNGFSGVKLAATGWKAKSLGTLSLLEIPLSVIAEFSLIRLENWVEDKLLEKWQVNDLRNQLADRMMEFDQQVFCSNADPTLEELSQWMAPVAEAFQHYYAYLDIISPLSKAHAEFQAEKHRLSKDVRYWQQIKRDYDQASLTGAPVGSGILIGDTLSYGIFEFPLPTILSSLEEAKREYKQNLIELTQAYEKKKKPLLLAHEEARKQDEDRSLEFFIPVHPNMEPLLGSSISRDLIANDFFEEEESWKQHLRTQVEEQVSTHTWNMQREMELFFESRFLVLGDMDLAERSSQLCTRWRSTPAMRRLGKIDWRRRP